MPPDDISSTSGFITSVEQAKQFWNDWSPWTVTEDVFELDAFLEIAEKISFKNKSKYIENEHTDNDLDTTK